MTDYDRIDMTRVSCKSVLRALSWPVGELYTPVEGETFDKLLSMVTCRDRVVFDIGRELRRLRCLGKK